MKKIVASVGLVALGASTINAAMAPDLGADPSKPWSISAKLRGFYDDNINTQPSGPGRVDSYGFAVSPGVNLILPLEQTTISFGYEFSAIYYATQVGANDPSFNRSHWDLTHAFNGQLDHQFTERYSLSLGDGLVVGQEPDALGYDIINRPIRTSGDNIRNYGWINFDARITRLFSVEVGYANGFYDYADTLARRRSMNPLALPPTLAGTLNRLDHVGHIDGRWQFLPTTTGVLGYEYEQVNYTGDEFIDPGLTTKSSFRNNRSHIGYVGVDHKFTSDLSVSARVGAQSIDFYNDPKVSSEISPWAKASLQYEYMAGSSAAVGFSYYRSATDVLGSGSSVTTDANYANLYATVNQQILPKLYGNITGTYQHSTFNNGSLDNSSEDLFLVGLDISYRFNRFLSADVGYNYDRLDSNSALSRSYDRNRVFIGITGSY